MSIEVIIGMILSGIVGMFFFTIKQDKKKLDSLEQRVTTLESKMVTEDKVREISNEEYDHIKQDVSEIKNTIKELQDLLTAFRVDLGILNYLKSNKEG